MTCKDAATAESNSTQQQGRYQQDSVKVALHQRRIPHVWPINVRTILQISRPVDFAVGSLEVAVEGNRHLEDDFLHELCVHECGWI